MGSNYPCHNSKAEIGSWMNNYITMCHVHVITYQCPSLSYSMLVKAPQAGICCIFHKTCTWLCFDLFLLPVLMGSCDTFTHIPQGYFTSTGTEWTKLPQCQWSNAEWYQWNWLEPNHSKTQQSTNKLFHFKLCLTSLSIKVSECFCEFNVWSMLNLYYWCTAYNIQ